MGALFGYLFAFSVCLLVLAVIAISAFALYGVSAVQRRRGNEPELEVVAVKSSSESE